MNDRELLELAAKAAGIEGKWAEWDHAYGDYLEFGLDCGGQTLWNPLADNGDALRLTVRLGLVVNPGCAHDEKNDLDYPYAATRRAIVRAAAEIGRQMQEGGAA